VLPEPSAPQARSTATDAFRTGYVAIVGRPNVGKSTLLNALLGSKISITSRKPQTTRHRITGVLTRATAQFIFVDTPGFQTGHRSALQRSMNHAVRTTLAEVDVILFVVAAGHYDAADRAVAQLLPASVPVILVLAKMDRFRDRSRMMKFLASRASEFDYGALVPVSARTGYQLPELLAEIESRLPTAPAFFDAETLTDRSERFLAAEIVREKAFRLLGDELPYGCTAVIEEFSDEPARADGAGRSCRIHATIIVERLAHKSIVIGAGGNKLKMIGTQARRDLEALLGARVHLVLFVKVQAGWQASDERLRSYGYA